MSGADEEATIVCTLDAMLERRGMTLRQLSVLTGVTPANLSILKNNRGRAIRFSTLAALCAALDCNVADLLARGDEAVRPKVRGGRPRTGD